MTKNKGCGTPANAVQQPPHLAMRLAPCKARSPDGVPPRFSPKGVIVPKAQLQARLPGTRSERALPAIACPSPASTSRPGHNAGRLMPKPPGSGSDEPPPAGTASRSDQPGSPADVLHGEREWVRYSNPKRDVKAFRFVQTNRGLARRVFLIRKQQLLDKGLRETRPLVRKFV